MRNGHILTTQNATEYKTMNTKEQLDQPTDLFILPDKYDAQRPTSAYGYIYFDDGVSYEKHVTRYDFTYAYDAQAPATTTVLSINEMTTDGYRQGTMNE